MPVWMQVALPIFTALLGGGAGFAFGRLGNALDRRQERLDAEATAKAAEAAAKAEAEAARARQMAEWQAAKLPKFVVHLLDGDGIRIENLSKHRATGISVTFDGYRRKKVKGLPGEPFTLDAYKSVDLHLPGIGEMFDMPKMWVMCTEYAEPVLVQIPRKLPW